MNRYSLLQRLLHWLIAIVVVVTLGTGLILGILEFDGTKETFGGPATNMLYEYHKTFGLIILGLMLIRLLVRFEHGKPPHYEIATWERVASSVVQYLLYLALLVQPVLGWLATDASNFPVEFFQWNAPDVLPKSKPMADFGKTLYGLHGIVGWSILVLLVLHIGGALKHWIFDRNSVMWRIGFFGPSTRDPW